jgi:hypothetical protein
VQEDLELQGATQTSEGRRLYLKIITRRVNRGETGLSFESDEKEVKAWKAEWGKAEAEKAELARKEEEAALARRSEKESADKLAADKAYVAARLTPRAQGYELQQQAHEDEKRQAERGGTGDDGAEEEGGGDRKRGAGVEAESRAELGQREQEGAAKREAESSAGAGEREAKRQRVAGRGPLTPLSTQFRQNGLNFDRIVLGRSRELEGLL